MAPADPLRRRRVADRDRAQHRQRRPRVENGVHVGLGAKPAPDLQRQPHRGDPAQRIGVTAPAGERAVEIDEVQAAGPGGGEPSRDLPRRARVDGRVLAPTGPQPDRRAVEQVDGGQDDHESTNPRRSSRPAVWLFSG